MWGQPAWRGLAFGAERRFQLLTLLALEGGAWVERDRAAALLWPTHGMAEARRNLRKVVFDAQALPAMQGFEAQPQALRWVVDSDWSLLPGAAADTTAALRRGPPLQGLDDARNAAWSQWLAEQRARLDQAWLLRAHSHLTAATEPASRAALARQILQADALDEAAMAALLQAERAQGRTAQAQAEYRRYAALLAQELGVEPSRALRDLLSAAPAVAAATPAATGAAPEGGFIGRRTELAELRALLANPECRLLTVLGPGGIGKSSFVRQALPRIAPLFGAGAAWVPLHDAASAAELQARVAQTLGARLGDGADPLADLLRGWLGAGEGTSRGLLVLDNTEHLAGLAPRLQALLEALPGLVLLLTSRTRLPLTGEWLLPLQGLAVPDEDSRDLEAASAFDAVRLFEQRAQVARRSFTLGAHLPAVLSVCGALGGMPLAIELAASWVRLLPPETIAEDIGAGASQALDILQRDPGAAGEPLRAEHRSLRAVLQGSWRLLGAPEQRALAGLAIFAGGFTRAAAQAVVGCPLPLLSSLADASLLAVDATSGRFSMHPVVQQFARERLAEDAPRRAGLAERHAAHFAQQLAAWAPLVRTQPQQLVRQMAAEEANARLAWQHALDAAQATRLLQMLPAWRALFETSGRLDEGLQMLRAPLVLPEADGDTTRLLAHVRHVLCTLLYRRGQAAEALAFAEAGIASALRCGERVPLKGCLNNAALVLWLLGRADGALQHASRMLSECEADGDRYGIQIALGTRAIATKALGRFDEALADNQRALAIAQELGDPANIGTRLNNIGNLHRAQARWHEARASFEAGLRHGEQHGLASHVSFCLLNLGLVEFELGETERAHARLAGVLERQAQVPQQQVALNAELGLARIHIRRGERRELRQRLRRVETAARSAALLPMRLQALQVWAEALWHEGRPAEALPLMHWLAQHPGLDAADRMASRRQLEAAGGDPGAGWALDLEATVALMLSDAG